MNAYGRAGRDRRGNLMVAAPLVLVAAVVGVSLLSGTDEAADPASPPASLGPVARASPTAWAVGSFRPPATPGVPVAVPCPDPPFGPPLTAGPHDLIGPGPLQLTITLAEEGWTRGCSEPGTWVAWRDGGGVIGFTTADAIPCFEMAFRDAPMVDIDGVAAVPLEFRPEWGCHPNMVLTALGDPGGRGPDTLLTVWVFEGDVMPPVMYAAVGPADAGREEALRRIVESARISVIPEPPMPPPNDPVFPPAGELVPGAYWATVDGRGKNRPDAFTFSFHVPSPGWVSSGPGRDGMYGAISRGTPGAKDGAIIRFDNPSMVSADPCAHLQGRPVGASVESLAAAMAGIPGLSVVRQSVVPLRYSTAVELELTPDELPCDPSDAVLWFEDINGPPRVPAAAHSTIRVWIFNPNDRIVFGRVVVDAETFAGADAELERQIEHIVGSISHGG